MPNTLANQTNSGNPVAQYSGDEATTVGQLLALVHDFVAARDWYTYHTPKNLAMSIAIEAAEIMEHFQWSSLAESQQFLLDPTNRAEVADELADVMIYCLSFANASGIDISQAIQTKLTRNESRFPVGAVRGRLGVDDSTSPTTGEQATD
ncbi:MAG: nucleotide pyrophosphohydrolase [Caldilineaceae bacterium]|nr:nucleotide pyrophosphohydrolase [Caldilineaceae bacterium]